MTTNQPLSLFISSKMQELAEERRAVQAALSDYHMYGWLWEDDAGARPMPTRATYLKEVEESDIYLGLFWLGYGPYTIEEYEHARQRSKPCLVYQKYIETEKRDLQLARFLAQIEAVDNPIGLTVRRFTTAEELAKYVQEDVLRLLTDVFRDSRRQPANPPSVDGPAGRSLAIMEQVELTDLLLKCAAIRRDAQRAAVLDLLPSEIMQRINRGDTAITDVLQIVKKCNDYEGGIEKLYRATVFVDGNTRSVQAVATFLRAHSFLV